MKQNRTKEKEKKEKLKTDIPNTWKKWWTIS